VENSDYNAYSRAFEAFDEELEFITVMDCTQSTPGSWMIYPLVSDTFVERNTWIHSKVVNMSSTLRLEICV
jgi:hypothetical protein